MFDPLRALWATALAIGAPALLFSNTEVQAANSKEAKVVWYQDWAHAKKQAARLNRPLFILFTGSDWCKWCVKLEKEVLDQPAFAAATADQYVFMLVDRPRKKKLPERVEEQNGLLCDRFQIDGYPTVLIVLPDEAETVIGEVGYDAGGVAGFLKELRAITASN
jgi:protein disulfide-isomerase